MQLNPFHKNFRVQERAEKAVRKHNNHIMQVAYSANENCYLAELCQKHGSDKGGIKVGHGHTYTDFYELIFGRTRESVNNVLECGIARNIAIDGKKIGTSLRVWRDYFPNANIVGIDISDARMFTDDRIKTYLVDQTDPKSIAQFKTKCDNKFEIIIDDGLHTFDAGKILFENMFDRLTDNGIYIIEDITPRDRVKFADYFANQNDLFIRFVNLYRPDKKLGDNSLVVITKK